MIHRQTTERERGGKRDLYISMRMSIQHVHMSIPDDHSRVKLSLDHEGSDFINANYVPVSKVIDRHVTSRHSA